MCILCVIQKWSRTVATMLPWLAIPLIGFWALSQLLPPAFRFEITSPRLACVFVLLVTLFWYEILMPQLSVWRAKRSARVRDRKRFEAIELQKLRKSAIRRCRNCLTAYKDQNPGGGKFMCSYCGHISKRPVLDLNMPPGMGLSKSGILKGLMGRSGKIFDRKVWICGQDWLENGSWRRGGGDDNCLSEKSCSRVLIFFSKAGKAFFLRIIWLWRKIFGISSSRDDISTDAETRGVLDQRGENAGNCEESKSDRARRKAEEKRQARLEKELLEEEERKQREEIAKLVEERRRLRDEKMEAEKQHEKGSPLVKENDRKKEAERKRQERKKDKDRSSSKSNSDVEELERRFCKENERHRKNDSNHHRGNVGTGYLDRMKGTIFSSSRGFFGRGANVTSVSREHSQTSAYRRESSRPDRATGKRYMNADQNKNTINRHVLIEPQADTSPKKSWQQLFTDSSSVTPASSPSVISRPNGNSQSEVHTSKFVPHSPFSVPSFCFNSTSNSTDLSLSSEAIFPRIGEKPGQFLPEESEIFEDPCYVPNPASLLGPVSESLDNFQLDLGFVGDTVVERPSPIKSPMSRSRVPEERHPTSNVGDSWQMWSSSPLGPDSVGLFGGSAKWFLPHEIIGAKKEDPIQPVAPKTMASLFKRDERVLSEPRSPRNNFIGNGQNGEMYNSVPPVSANGPWLANSYFGSTPGNENCWMKKDGEVGGSGDGVGKSSMTRPPIIGLYSSADVPSVWAYD